MGNRGRGIALGLLLLLWASMAFAQTATTGGIYGVVTDAKTGEALPGVTVVVTSSASVSQSALTDEKGAYRITDLSPGDYLVTFYYLDATIERPVPVGVQKVTPVYQKIDTSEATKGEVVRIEGKTPTIDPTSTAQGITVDKNYLKNIPVPGRTFEAALGAAAGSQGDILGVAFSGSTSLENQYYVDGVNTTGLSYGTVGSPIINDFIEEIEIITGGYNAEYGRATGGIVNVVTKSGSNDFKGSIFGTWQPGQLTAQVERAPTNASSLDVTADVGYRADFGFELGGPIVKDKAWFFIGFAPQFLQIDYTRQTKRRTDCHKINDDGSVSDCNNALNSDGGYADTDPDIDPKTGFFITDPVDTEIRSRNSYVYNLLGKINYAATPEQQGQLAVTLQPGGVRMPGLYGPSNAGYLDSFLTTDVSAKWTSKFNDGKTEVEGLLGVHRDDYARKGLDPTTADDPLQILVNKDLGTWGRGFGESMTTTSMCTDGVPGSGDQYPYITNCPMNNRAYYIGGPGGVADDTDQRAAAKLGITQRVKAAGTHEIKGGIDVENNVTHHTRAVSGGAEIVNFVNTEVDVYRWVQITTPENTDSRFDQSCGTPAPAFDPTAPTMYKCDYLSGHPGDQGNIVGGNTLNWSAYLRDSWQVRPNLTINAGLRMEEQRLRYAEFLRNQVNPVSGDVLGKNALVLKNQLAPRIGLLYDWTKEGRSKIYAHWGRFYESIPMEINDYNFGMPVFYIQSYTPGRCGGMSDPRIGGYDGMSCLDTTTKPDLREELIGASGSLIAPGVKGQYLDEVVGGVQFEVIDDLKLGVSLQDRRFGRVIEDVSVDNANTYIVSNPGEFSEAEEKKFETKIANETDPNVKARLMRELVMFKGIRIFDRPRRDYDALQFTLERRFSKNIYVQASYTYSRTLGNYPGLINYDDNIVLPNNSTQYDLIELLANKLGPLPQDRPHYIKFDGYRTFDLKKAGQVTTGVRFRALSGVPRNALAPHYLYGEDESFLLPRGSIGRASFEHGLDVHISYGRKLNVSKREWLAELFANIYNVYNNQGTAAVDNTYAPAFKQGTANMNDSTRQAANPVAGGTYEDLIWVKTIDRDGNEQNSPIGRNPNFGNTTQRYAPLYIQFGARLTF